MIAITSSLALADNELQESFIHSSGPGGQNVNKVATAVQLRFDVQHSPSLPPSVRDRLLHLARNRITTEGVLMIEAKRFRTQEQNRADARQRLIELIRQATVIPKRRRPTRPTLAAKRRRVEAKRHRGAIKRGRGSAADTND